MHPTNIILYIYASQVFGLCIEWIAVASALKAWPASIPGPVGPPSSCGPPQVALGPTALRRGGSHSVVVSGDTSRRHDT